MVEARFTLLEKENQQLRQQLADTNMKLVNTVNKLNDTQAKLITTKNDVSTLQNTTTDHQTRLHNLEGMLTLISHNLLIMYSTC
jgi:chromosome segregation ATPase